MDGLSYYISVLFPRESNTHQVNDPRGCEPHRYEYGDELGQPDGGGRLEDVEVLEDVGHGHQAEGAEEAEAWKLRRSSLVATLLCYMRHRLILRTS